MHKIGTFLKRALRLYWVYFGWLLRIATVAIVLLVVAAIVWSAFA